MDYPKAERLAEFLRRLQALAPASSLEEARGQIETTLNAVEDEMTEIPYNPDAWQSDGRMYAARDDGARPVPGYPTVTRFRSRGHNTYLGANGAIEIREFTGSKVLLSKPASDGKGVWEA